MRVLFLNHKIQACGVYQYGLRISMIFKKSFDIDYKYVELDSLNEYNLLCEEGFDAIIYNFCHVTMPWLTIDTINKSIPNVGLLHPNSPHIFTYNCNLNPLYVDNNNNFGIPRPLIEFTHDQLCEYESICQQNDFIQKYQNDHVPIFGSFGFACGYKGFVKMISMINDQYDDAIIKIVMPAADFYPKSYVKTEYDKL